MGPRTRALSLAGVLGLAAACADDRGERHRPRDALDDGVVDAASEALPIPGWSIRDGRCTVAIWQDGAPCAETFARAAAELLCPYLPDGAALTVGSCGGFRATRFTSPEQSSTCYYDRRTGALVGSRGSRRDHPYCAGIFEEVFWGTTPPACTFTEIVRQEVCPLPDGGADDGATDAGGAD